MPLTRRTLIALREHLTNLTLRQIRDEFDAIGVQPDPDFQPTGLSGERRILVEQAYSTLDLDQPADAQRLVELLERVLPTVEPNTKKELLDLLAADGFDYEDGKLLPRAEIRGVPDLPRGLESLDSGHLRVYIRRMIGFIDSDPDLAIGAAKELIESVCKTILHTRGEPVDDNPALPQLVKRVARALEIHPDDVSESVKGATTIRSVLGSVGNIASGVNELRGLYGSGHGRDGRWRGVTPRHARLVAGLASSLTTFLLETHVRDLPEQPEGAFDGRYVTPGFPDQAGAEISLLQLRNGQFEVQGFALSASPELPGIRRAPSTGDFHGAGTVEDGVLTVKDGDCVAMIEFVGSQLVVKDNRKCGGTGASFTGEYRFAGPPHFIDI